MSNKEIGILVGAIAFVGLFMFLLQPASTGGYSKPIFKKSGVSEYENMEYWHITWDLENLVPTDIAIKRHATETMEV